MVDRLLHRNSRVHRQEERVALRMLRVLRNIGLQQTRRIGKIILPRETVVDLDQADLERRSVIDFGACRARRLKPPEPQLDQLLVQLLYVAHSKALSTRYPSVRRVIMHSLCGKDKVFLPGISQVDRRNPSISREKRFHRPPPGPKTRRDASNK